MYFHMPWKAINRERRKSISCSYPHDCSFRIESGPSTTSGIGKFQPLEMIQHLEGDLRSVSRIESGKRWVFVVHLAVISGYDCQSQPFLPCIGKKGRRIKICLVAQINGITVSPDIIIIEFTAFDEHETMASVKTI